MVLAHKGLRALVVVLCAVGALNWGLVALFDFNVVEFLANLVHAPMVAKVLYIVVGVAGALALVDCVVNECK